MPDAAQRPAERFTYADYCRWPDEERWELIGGQAYLMVAPQRAHQALTMELGRQVANQLLGQACQVYSAPFDVRLPEVAEADDEVTTVVQPDLVVVCDPAKLDARGCRGAPDWVVEVLSPSTASRDEIEKRALYERHGVREYWLVATDTGLVRIYRLGEQGYDRSEVHRLEGELPVQAVPGLVIDWSLWAPPEPAEKTRPAR